MIPLPPVGMLRIISSVAVGTALFSAGAAVNGWRLNASFAKEKAELNALIHDLENKVVTQNAAVDTLYIRSKEAELRRKQAEKYSADVVKSINNHKAVIENSTATDCEGVLKEAHEDAR